MNELLYNIIVQAIGVAGIAASIFSAQCKRQKNLLWFRTANESLFAVQYIMLGAYTGAAMNIIGCVRNCIFVNLVKKEKSTVPMRCLFSVLFVAGALATWSGPKSILIGIAKVLSTVAYGSSSTGFARILLLITTTLWFTYNLIVGSYAGCVCEAFTMCSVIVGILRLDVKKSQKTA